ncbi:MAG TPA: hypothetical protein PL029_08995, partial [Bacteroidia bacterium]|nr:hypothetical protein [Bacteroidia bacterium]
MKKIFFCTFFLSSLYKIYAQPGKDGPLTVNTPTQIINQYSPLSASISASSNTLSIASTTNISLCGGDLIMVYQAQGATLDFTNTANYGDITAYNSAGLYEFKYVQSVIGNVITTQTTFTNSYSLSGYPQVIRVPQFTTLTVNPGGSIVPKPWKDTVISGVSYRFGGLVVIHAADIVNNGLINANGSGFRGGATPTNSLSSLGPTLYVSNLIADGGEKGEGIFGNQADYDLNGGRYGRGAPGNGGGGGKAHNAGGGGGANAFNGNVWNGAGEMVVNPTNLLAAWALDPDYIANGNSLTTSSGGGRGGYTYGAVNANANVDAPGAVIWSGDFRRNVGGRGGRPLINI